MSALDARHAWAVAEDRQGKSAVYFFDGSAWSKSFEPAEGKRCSASPRRIHLTRGGRVRSRDRRRIDFPFRREHVEEAVRDRRGVAQGHRPDARHAWATGGIGTTGPIYYFGGSYWSKQFSGKEPLFDVSAPDSSHAWAVGGLGSIFTYEPAAPDSGGLQAH